MERTAENMTEEPKKGFIKYGVPKDKMKRYGVPPENQPAEPGVSPGKKGLVRKGVPPDDVIIKEGEGKGPDAK